jgi:hypothetical protein
MMWPQAGPASAGRWARLVGTRLGTSGAPLAVTLGGVPCAVTAWDSSSITLNVPALPAGWHDAIVVTAEGADTLARAYRAIQPALTSGDRTPPLVDVSRPERRYWDRTPPAVQLTAHDRLGMDSLAIRFDGGPWQTLAAGIADTSVSTAVVVPYAQWAAATDGPHAISIRARDDAGNVTLDDWTWIKGLPSSGIWRLNCGGPEYVSSTGATFGADTGPAYGTTLGTSQPIAGTADPALYQTARTTADSLTPLVYALPTGNRAYQLRLHVAEIDSACAAPGRRVFDVFAEADTLVRALDPSTGGAFRAVERDAEALVTDGQLDLVLRATRARPLLSALEVIPLGLDDATPPSIAPLPQPAGLTWANPPVLTLQASDPNDGELFALHYAIDGGPWRTVRSALAARSYASAWAMPPAAFQAAGPGPHTLVVRAVDLAGATAETPPWAFTVSDVVAAPAGPAAATVRAWPNPTRGRRLSVSFAPTRAGEASVEVFDVSGRRVHARDLGWREAGPATLALDGALRGAGLWFVRVRAPGVDRTLRVVALD